MRGSVPTGDVATSRLIYVCHAVLLVVVHLPLLHSASALTVSHLHGWYVLAHSHEHSMNVVNKKMSS